MYQLKNIVILFRHGAREPTNNKDQIHQCIYQDWNQKRAYLTDIGKKQSEILGKTLAKYYKKYNFNPENVYADSSNKERTITSKNHFLKGWGNIYPNTVNKIKNKDINTFLRPYKSLKNYKCYNRTKPLNSCQTYYQKYSRNSDYCDYYSSKREKDFINSEVNNKLRDKCNIDYHNNSFDKLMFKLYQNQLINGASNNNDVFWNKNQSIINNYAYLHFNNKYRDPHINCLTSGTIPGDIINWLSNPKSSAYLLFAHDTLLASLLSYLGLKNWTIPGFNSYLGFELWENKTGHKIVRLFYNSDPFHGTELFVRTDKLYYFILPPVGSKIDYKNKSIKYMEWYKFTELMKRCLISGEYVLYDENNAKILINNNCKLYKDI